MEEKLERW